MSEKCTIELLESDFLLNSKILFELKRNSANDPNLIRIFHATDGLGIYLIEKDSLYFSTHSTPKFALNIFIQLTSNPIKIIEGSEAVIKEICTYVEMKNQQFKIINVSLFSCQASFPNLGMHNGIELIKGDDLFDFGGESLVSQFIDERLERSASKLHIASLILSSSNEFFGLKRGKEVLCIAAWIREIKRYRCLSYVYTQIKYRSQGFAQLLLAKILSESASHYDGYYLFVDSLNIAAVTLYQKLGFRKTGVLSILRLVEPTNFNSFKIH